MDRFDWLRNNTLKNDRYTETDYKAEKASIAVDSAGRYVLGTEMDPNRIQTGSKLEPQHNLTEHNITKHNITEQNRGRGSPAAGPPARALFAPPGVEEVKEYCVEQGLHQVDPARFVDHYTANGWMVGKTKMKDWQAAVRNWASRELEQSRPKKTKAAQELDDFYDRMAKWASEEEGESAADLWGQAGGADGLPLL